MPILPSQKNPLLLLKAVRDKLTADTNITNFDIDSKARVMGDVFVEEELSSQEEMVIAFYGQQLSNAVKEQLDEIGRSLGLPRRELTSASVIVAEQNLAFYVESGTFGSINSGLPIVVPAGTVIRSDPDANELGSRIEYTTQQAHILLAIDTISFVEAKASTFGNRSNLGAETLRSHSFTGYTNSLLDALKVVNFYPILNGRNRETDDSYRFRLSQFYIAIIQANSTRIKMNSLQVPGVIQTNVLPGYYGIGSAAALVLGAENLTNTRMLNGVQQHLNAVQTPGYKSLAIAASQVSFDITLEVKTRQDLTVRQKTDVEIEIKRGLIEYFRRRVLADIIDLDEIMRMIRRAAGRIASFDSVGGKKKLIKKAWVRKGLAGGFTDERQRLIGTLYQLAGHEFAALGTLNIIFL
jgi:uncharacterized phage protein gp47/JayE